MLRLVALSLALTALLPAQDVRFSPFRPAHAAFSRPLNRIIVTNAGANSVTLYDPDSVTIPTSLALPAPATALSLSPDGLTLAVGHSNQISYFQLASATLLRTIPTPAPVRELLLAPPSLHVDLGPNNVRTFAVAGGASTDPLPGLPALVSPQLSSDGRTLFSASAPDFLDRFDLLTNTVTRTILNHCNRIQLSSDNSKLYTACGVAYQNTPALPYAGTAIVNPPHGLIAESPGGRIALFDPTGDGLTVALFSQSHLRRVATAKFNQLFPNSPTTTQPRWLFLNADGTRVHMISLSTSTEPRTAIVQSGMESFDLSTPQPNCVLFASDNDADTRNRVRPLPSEGGLVNITLAAQFGCPYLPASSVPWITITDRRSAVGAGPFLLHVERNTGPARSGLITAGNFSIPISQEAASGFPTRQRLSYRVTQSAFARPLNRLILASDTPNTLHIIDPVSRVDQAIDLPRPPTALALRPDGQFAAVGHDAGVSLVNLLTAQVEAFFPVPLEVATLAFSPRSLLFAYPTPGRGNPTSLNLITGALTPLPSAAPTSVLRLSPDGNTFALAGIIRLELATITGNTISLAFTPFLPHCGNVWFVESGRRILTACGTSFLADSLTPSTTLNTRINAADHSPARATTAALTPNPLAFQSDQLRLFSDTDTGSSVTDVEPFSSQIIGTPTVSGPFPLIGRLVAWGPEETTLHLISEIANAQSATPIGFNRTVVESISPQSDCVSGVTSTPADREAPAAGGLLVFTASARFGCLWQVSSSTPWLRLLANSPQLGSSPVQIQVPPNPGIAPREGIINLGGFPVRVTQLGQPVELFPASLTVAAVPNPVTIRINAADPQLAWRAASSTSPWINFSRTTGVGSADLTLIIAPNPGPTRVGTFTVNSVPFTLVQSSAVPSPNQPPTVLPVPDSTASGRFTQRSFRFADPDGVNDLAILNVLINASLDGRDACHIAYDIRANLLYLVNSDGIEATTAPLSVPSVRSNDRCSINTNAVQFTREVNSVTLTVLYNFVRVPNTPGHAIFAAARDRQGNNSGWQLVGRQNVGEDFLNLNLYSILPSSPTPDRPISVEYRVVFGVPDAPPSSNEHRFAQVLIQNSLDGRNACYIGFDRAANLLYLMNDEGTRLLPNALRLNGASGGVNQIENSQCRITSLGSTFELSGNRLRLNLNISFKQAFAGPRLIYAAFQTPLGNSGWQMVGFLNVAPF